LIATGLTAVVNVRDHERLNKSLNKFAEYANEQAEMMKKRFEENGFVPSTQMTVKSFDHNGNKIFYMNIVGRDSVVTPAWCLTEKEFIVSAFPAHVKGYLSRKSDAKSLATVSEVAAALASEHPPTMLAYQDTKELVKLAYPIAQVLANVLVGEMQRDGVDIDMSAFPSAGAILPHLQPSMSTLSPTKDGLEMTTRQTLPMAFGIWQALPAAWFTIRSSEMHRLEKEAFPPHLHDGFDEKFDFEALPRGGGAFWLPALPKDAGAALAAP
jgi:hypothetical protein